MKKTLLLLIVAGGYWLLLARPGLYYDKSLEYRNFTLRARGALPERADVVLDKVYDKISTSELFAPDKKFYIYLPGGRNEFLFFTPLLNGTYARVNPFNGSVFIAAADFGADRARTAPGAAEYRALSTELAGAAAREMARRAVKPFTYLIMSDWKLRGYSELLSGGAGTYMPADICKGENPAMLDYKYGLAVEYALRVEGISFNELLNKDYSYEKVAEGLKKMTCGG
ncbi:MAG: hypothetical protein AAB359_09940 [Elusimicrobiota bacterium]